MYQSFSSNNFALKSKRKTITAKDVLDALEDMEFDQFVDPLKECLEGLKDKCYNIYVSGYKVMLR